MTIEDQIAELLAEAEPLRCLPALEAEEKGLPGIVNRINALRAQQAASPVEIVMLLPATDPMVVARKKPGPKPKAKIEGADA